MNGLLALGGGVSLFDLLALPTVQRSVVAVVIASIALPVVGVFIIGLDVIPLRFAMMHVALLGVVLATWAGIEPLLVAPVLCAVAGASLAPFAGRDGGLAAPTGLLSTLALALALLALAASGVNANGAFALLWGSVLVTRRLDLIVLGVIAVCVLAFYAIWRRSLALLLFDRDLAEASGVRVAGLTVGLLVLVALGTASAVRLTGALLVDAVTLLPAMAARPFATSLRSAVRLAVGFGLVGNLGGLLIALALDQPPGVLMVLTSGCLTIGSYVVTRRGGRWSSAVTTAG